MRPAAIAPVLAALAAVGMVGAVASSPAAYAQGPQTPQPWGTWILATHLVTDGAPPSLPTIVTLHKEGTANSSPANMFGTSGAGLRWVSPLHDVWERTGPQTIGTTCIAFIFQAGTGRLLGFGRVRGELELEDFDHLRGQMYFDFLPCPAPQFCPDPVDPEATWSVWPGTSPQGHAVSAVRLRRVAVGPLEP